MRFIRKTNYYQDIQIFKHEGQIFWYACLALILFSFPFFLSDFYLGELALIFVAIGFGLVILISIILVVASLSPELATDEPEYEIGSGENKVKSFSWEYNDRYYSVEFTLNEGTYKHFQSKYNYCC